MEAVAEHELSVVLSSHLVADLERVCDYLIVLVASRVQLAGDVDDAAGHAPPADRPAPRPGHAAGRPARDRGQPHRPADHPADPHRPARSTTRPGPSSRSAWRTSCSPTWHETAIVRQRAGAAGGASDDLAHLAPVPRLRRTSRSARSPRSPLTFAVTGPGLAHYYSTTDHHCTARGDCDVGHRRFFTRRAPVPAAPEPSCSSCPALIGIFWGAPLIARELEAGTLPARLDAERHPHPVAGGQARRRRAGQRGSPRACCSLLVTWWSEPARQVQPQPLAAAHLQRSAASSRSGYAAFAFASA